jgi:hypothetical protein
VEYSRACYLFDASGQHAPPLDTGYPVATREALSVYDPGLFALVEPFLVLAVGLLAAGGEREEGRI